nr:PREDICTED: uncharacterized protein LOC109036059 isoform X3 [Bemisia tabaci]
MNIYKLMKTVSIFSFVILETKIVRAQSRNFTNPRGPGYPMKSKQQGSFSRGENIQYGRMKDRSFRRHQNHPDSYKGEGRRRDYATRRDGFSSDRKGFSSSRGGPSSERKGFSSRREGFSPGRERFSSGREGFSSGRESFSSAQKDNQTERPQTRPRLSPRIGPYKPESRVSRAASLMISRLLWPKEK